MRPISMSMIEEVSGDELRANLDAYSDHIKGVIEAGKVVLVRGYLDDKAVKSVRQTAIDLRVEQPVTEGKLLFSEGNVDIHNREAPHFRIQDRIKAKFVRKSLRFRKFHGYKFFLWNKHDEPCDQAFHDVIRLRNCLYGVEPDFAVDLPQGFFIII